MIREQTDDQGNVVPGTRQEFDQWWRAPSTGTPNQELDPVNPNAPEPVQERQKAPQRQQREIRSAEFQRQQAEFREESIRNWIQRLEQAGENTRYRVSDRLAQDVRDHRGVDLAVGDDNLVSREMLLDYRRNQAEQLSQAQRELDQFIDRAGENLEQIEQNTNTTNNSNISNQKPSAYEQ